MLYTTSYTYITYIDQLFIPPPILNHGIYFLIVYNFLIDQTFFAYVLPVEYSITNSPFYIVENNTNTGLFNKSGIQIISPFTDLSENTKKSIYIREEGLWGART
jgi:hypothetical protein